MKYRVYVRTPEETTTVINTDSLYKAARAYYPIVMSCGGPRLSVDGRELRIHEADAMAVDALRKGDKKKTGAMIRHDIDRGAI
jgi:hypothetical protein